jgi:ferredoxin
MSIANKNLHLCNCNRTMPLDGTAIGEALGCADALPIHEQLCQRQLNRFTDNAAGDVLVACTQESKLFSGVADESKRVTALRFVNIREHGGWSREAAQATPKMAALLAAAALPEPEPVPSVSYTSAGQLLIIGAAADALACAALLPDSLSVSILATDVRGAELPAVRNFPIYSGALQSIEGWLGAFSVEWTQTNPIDLDVCTRCGACVRACPEHAIDWNYQIDLDRCRSHRACVAACGDARAVDFERRDVARKLQFDLILDLSRAPAFKQHQPPQGYFAPGRDEHLRTKVLLELAQLVGEFDKPRFFAYKESICVHGRSKKTACTRCYDSCSTAAIAFAGDYIRVEPHLCMGCGTCTTVCPSGALTYAYPRVPDLGQRIKTLLTTYRGAGGRDACLLVHSAEAGTARVAQLARHGAGLPARVIPLAVHQVASVGMDVWLGAIAYGASQVAVLLEGDEAPEYREALGPQMSYAERIAQGLGYQGTHFVLIDGAEIPAFERAIWGLAPASSVDDPATFNLAADKRTTIAMAVEHLQAQASSPQEPIALPAGAPYGTLVVNADKCTLCMACVSACPVGALLDSPELPQLRFIESKCVQCGLCATTCPETAIALQPRLALTREAKQPRVLNQDTVLHCSVCGKPLGARKMLAAMAAKLGSHSMWQGPGALDRMTMCADCRVKDMMKNELL